MANYINMGGGKRQAQADAKMNRLTGTNVDVRRKDKGKEVTNKGGFINKVRDKDFVMRFSHRKGHQGKKFWGTRYRNPSLSAQRGYTGYLAEKKFNDNTGKTTKPFNSYNHNLECGSAISRLCYDPSEDSSVHSSKVHFCALFLLNGLDYLKLFDSIRDGDVLADFVITKFLTVFGYRHKEKMMLLNDEAFWKEVVKQIGAFVCPRNTVMINNRPTVIHKIPKSALRSASLAKIQSDKSKSERVKPVMPGKLRGGGEYGYYSPLAGGGPNPSFRSCAKDINKGCGSNSKVKKDPLPPSGVRVFKDPDPKGLLGRGEVDMDKHDGIAPALPVFNVTVPGKVTTHQGKPQDPSKNREDAASESSESDDKMSEETEEQEQEMEEENREGRKPKHFGKVDDVCNRYVGGYIGGGPADFLFDSVEICKLYDNLADLGPHRETDIGIGVNISRYNMHGAPFCGMTCIDSAVRRECNPREYAAKVPKLKIDKEDHFDFDPIECVGGEDYLVAYAQSRSCGLVFLMDAAIVGLGEGLVIHRIADAGTNKFAVLYHSNDHWTLFGKHQSNRNHMYLTGKYNSVDIGWRYFGIGDKIEFGPLCLRLNNNDVRSYSASREPVEVQGMDQLVTITPNRVHLLGLKFRYNPFKWRRTYRIDSTRCHEMAKQLVFCKTQQDVDDVLQGLLLGRTINSTVDPKATSTSCKVMRRLSKKLKRERTTKVTAGMVTVNVPGSTSLIKNIPTIVENARLAGGGNNFAANHVKMKTWREKTGPTKSKLDVPVAVAPIGCPVEKNRAVGPGLIGLTDEKTTVSAFWSRSCSKKSPVLSLDNDGKPIVTDEGFMAYQRRRKFVDDSKTFMGDIIKRTDMDHAPQEDASLSGLINQFRKVNSGKKPAKWIERRIRDYIKFVAGKMHPKEELKYKRHGCFVKFESNVKRRGEARGRGKVKMRPRLIMTMSGVMQFELCYLHEISEVWYEGPISEFQVKHMNADAMIDKIREAQDKRHVVTDYSAFESSILDDIREIEMHVIRSLCSKAGYFFTLFKLSELELDVGRILNAQSFDFYIISRCSGDYWTSLGNGIVSICLMRHCWELKEMDIMFTMLAEGDDGSIDELIPDEDILTGLGFEFSSKFKGSTPGDTDFLRCLWGRRRWLNIGRVISKIYWVKKGVSLRPSKQKFLLRTMALSLHHLSPGHPILWAVVKHIERETRGYNNFKSSALFLDSWKEWDFSGKFPIVECDESMRQTVAEGRVGFPPIPIIVQKTIERRILSGNLHFLGLLNEYDDYIDNVDSSDPDMIDWSQKDLSLTYKLHNYKYVPDDLSYYKEVGLVRQPSGRDNRTSQRTRNSSADVKTK